jgi:YqaJ-like viral recombinase domain
VKIIDCAQGSDLWLASRAGRVTASRIKDVLATIKTGEAAARRDYKAQLVCEILTGRPQEDGYVNAEMQFGIDTEPAARSAYEAAEGVLVDEVGFVLHPKIERAGASPDGLVSADGMVQIKCPKIATHITYLLDGVAPSLYQPQMLWEMACAERAWSDFVSFRPDLPDDLQLFTVRFFRDELRIEAMTKEVVTFLAEVDELVDRLLHRRTLIDQLAASLDPAGGQP